MKRRSRAGNSFSIDHVEDLSTRIKPSSRSVQMKKLLVALLILSLVAFVAAPVAAQDSPAGATVSAADVTPAVVLANKKATKHTFDAAHTGLIANTPNTFVPIDAAKVVSCGTATCIIEAEITVQVCPVGSDVVPIAYQFRVDGAAQLGSGLFNNVMDNAENGVYCDQGHARLVTTASLSPGNHTVQSFIYSGGTSNRNYYNIRYSQYKP
jgi:hypothetical protein